MHRRKYDIITTCANSGMMAQTGTCRKGEALRHKFYTEISIMEKIKNGDPVLYKNRKGTIYGKPRENKYKGLLYIVKIGDDYVKASANELTPTPEEIPVTNGFTF